MARRTPARQPQLEQSCAAHRGVAQEKREGAQKRSAVRCERCSAAVTAARALTLHAAKLRGYRSHAIRAGDGASMDRSRSRLPACAKLSKNSQLRRALVFRVAAWRPRKPWRLRRTRCAKCLRWRTTCFGAFDLPAARYARDSRCASVQGEDVAAGVAKRGARARRASSQSARPNMTDAPPLPHPQGWFNLARARYLMGAGSVGQLQFDQNMTASVRLIACDCALCAHFAPASTPLVTR